jgi:hypothetical protein
MNKKDIKDDIDDKFNEIENKIDNIRKKFLTEEEFKQMEEEETSYKIGNFYNALCEDGRRTNEMYKRVKYKIYKDSIEEVYNSLKENRIPEDRKDFELVRKSARKTALVLLNEIYRTTKDPVLHDHFSKLFAIIASD